MSFTQVIERIERRRDAPAQLESYLRTREALASLDLTFPNGGRGVILVAGTNGKGTVSKTLEVLLETRSPGVGLFTSPHLMSTTERIRSFGRDLSEDEFVAAFLLIEPLLNKYNLSHFEILTLMMAEVFFGGRVRPRVERAIIEVGVGGRLDPTRLIPHDTTVITRLGLDHQDLLGGSLSTIASEKFGAIDPGNLVVHAAFPAELHQLARDKENEMGGRWIAAEIFPSQVFDFHPPRWSLTTPWGTAILALPGARTAENVSLALTVLHAQGEPMEFLIPFVAASFWPGRMEEFRLLNRRVYLSGDHNPQGIESLSEILRQYTYENLYIVVGIGKNKDVVGMLSQLAELPRAKIVLTQTPFRSSQKEFYGDWLDRAELYESEPVSALRMALDRATEKDLVLVTGSLYLVGDLRREIVVKKTFGEFKA